MEMDREAISQDFKLLRSEGLNSLRIFIPYPGFGKADIDPAKLKRLMSFMDLANEYELGVLITLFDFYGNYDLPDWTLTHRHAEVIVKSLREHPALLGWDIKNEPDLDFENRGKERVIFWLNEMINHVKGWDSLHPVTIGWSNPTNARILKEKVDFISFHYYEDPASFLEAYNDLKKHVSDKEILLEEYGYSSYSGVANFWSGSEEKQARFFKEMEQVLGRAEIPALFWTLHDFEEVPNEVVGRLPWRKAHQKQFGVLRPDGSRKQAFDQLDKK
jgi:endo-1,4-beta-mannosidase